MKNLTEKQQNILNYVENFMERTHMAPTVYEIADQFGIKTSTVFAHLKALQKKNFLVRSSKARSIILVHPRKKTRNPTGLSAVPMEDSRMLFHDGTRNELYCDASLIGSSSASDVRNLLAVRVRGNSLKEAGILDGDIAILRKRPEQLKKGDIVLTWIKGAEEFRNCLGMEGENVILSGGSSGRKNLLYPSSELELKGVVVGIQRSLSTR